MVRGESCFGTALEVQARRAWARARAACAVGVVVALLCAQARPARADYSPTHDDVETAGEVIGYLFVGTVVSPFVNGYHIAIGERPRWYWIVSGIVSGLLWTVVSTVAMTNDEPTPGALSAFAVGALDLGLAIGAAVQPEHRLAAPTVERITLPPQMPSAPSAPLAGCISVGAALAPHCATPTTGGAFAPSGELVCSDGGRASCLGAQLVCDRGAPMCAGRLAASMPRYGTGPLAPMLVSRTMEEVAPLVRACVGGSEADEVVRARVDGLTGRVRAVRSVPERADAATVDCIARAVRTAVFPPFGPGSTELLYRFVPRRVVLADAATSLELVSMDPRDEVAPAVGANGWLAMEVRERAAAAAPAETSVVVLSVVELGRRSVVAEPALRATGPAWASDGSFLVYAAQVGGAPALFRWSAGAAGATPERLELDVGVGVRIEGSPAVSPDRARVVVRASDGRLSVCELAGRTCFVLGSGESPAWSPDGRLLAFVRRTPTGRQIYVAEARPWATAEQLTTGGDEAVHPTWAPDGRTLVFASNAGWDTTPGGTREGTWNLFARRFDGTVRQLTRGARTTTDPACAPDGWIYFTSNAGGQFDLWRLRMSGAASAAAP